ncbi:MAG TPA: hydroxymethylglutaryl-CoA reductase, degradative [Polyangiaceae bacterium]|nr:hydroxymethylglutaryl-CoA reductase, degradative [Polyangiaceae bacterium]
MARESRISGFYRLPLNQRRRAVCDVSGVDIDELTESLERGGLDPALADKIVENVLGTYGLPFGIALNARINERDRLIPMVVEEPSVIAAASNAARMVRSEGGFRAEVREALMTAQVQLTEVAEPERGAERVRASAHDLLALAARAVPGLIARGGGPRSLEVRDLGEGMLVVHVYIDCKDAMGANLANSVAEAVGEEVARIAGGRLGLRILSNLCDRRLVRVTAWASARDLRVRPEDGMDGSAPAEDVIDGIVAASRFAERDPYRAATHNKGIMNGVDSVVVATGNDYRAVEAGAHSFAARSGVYRPLAIWRRDGERLYGELEMPLALGTVGGTLRVHPTARLALKLAQVTSADDLAMLAASAGLASNLAALRALATEGIQRGHMSLHARSVATAAGASSEEVERVASALAATGAYDLAAAQRILRDLREP